MEIHLRLGNSIKNTLVFYLMGLFYMNRLNRAIAFCLILEPFEAIFFLILLIDPERTNAITPLFFGAV